MSMWQPYQFGISQVGPVWTELRPVGDVDRNWNCVDMDGNRIVAGEVNGRLWYYNGSSWTDMQPYGYPADVTWIDVAISGTHIIAVVYDIHKTVWYYDGATWHDLIWLYGLYGYYCDIDGTTAIITVAGFNTFPTTTYSYNTGTTLYTDESIGNGNVVALDGSNMLVAQYGNHRLYKSTVGGSPTEERPVGDVDRNWGAVDIAGSRMIAAVTNGRLYYSAGGWHEEQPAGAANYVWKDVSISGSRAVVVPKGSASAFRIYYFDGVTWVDPKPTGDEDKLWNCAVIKSNVIVAGVYNGRLYKGVM